MPKRIPDHIPDARFFCDRFKIDKVGTKAYIDFQTVSSTGFNASDPGKIIVGICNGVGMQLACFVTFDTLFHTMERLIREDSVVFHEERYFPVPTPESMKGKILPEEKLDFTAPVDRIVRRSKPNSGVKVSANDLKLKLKQSSHRLK